jgi:hypothetical protein
LYRADTGSTINFSKIGSCVNTCLDRYALDGIEWVKE